MAECNHNTPINITEATQQVKIMHVFQSQSKQKCSAKYTILSLVSEPYHVLIGRMSVNKVCEQAHQPRFHVIEATFSISCCCCFWCWI